MKVKNLWEKFFLKKGKPFIHKNRFLWKKVLTDTRRGGGQKSFGSWKHEKIAQIPFFYTSCKWFTPLITNRTWKLTSKKYNKWIAYFQLIFLKLKLPCSDTPKKLLLIKILFKILIEDKKRKYQKYIPISLFEGTNLTPFGVCQLKFNK